MCFLSLALLCRCALAGDVTFPSTGTDLGSVDDWGGAYPTAEDTVVIDVSAQGSTTLNLSENLTVAGILLTNMTKNVIINNSVSGKTLSLGAGGIRVTGGDDTRTLAVRVALELREDQDWDLGGIKSFGLSYGCTSWGGNASLTIKNVLTVTHYVPPSYAGAITYASSVNKVYYRKNGRWAAQLPTFNNSEGWVRIQADENLTWGTIFPYAVTSERAFTLEHPGFWSTTPGARGKTLDFVDGDSLTLSSSGKKLALDCGTLNQTGGSITADYLQVGSYLFPACWHISGGTATGSRITLAAHRAQEIGNVFLRNPFAYLPRTFRQTGGEVTVATLEMNWFGGSRYQMPSEYRLEDGTFTVTDNGDADNAVHLATFRRLNDGFLTSANGSFLQTGGTLTTPAIMLGASSTSTFGTYYPASAVSGVIDLTNGTMNVGSGGFCAGKSWVGSPSNSNYRVNLRGGTIRATDDFSSQLEMTVVDSGESVTFNTDGHSIALAAPVSGHGKLRKTGDGVLSIRDASAFKGELSVEGGTVALVGAPASGTVPSGCVRWTADDACVGLSSGDEVTTWTANTGAAAEWKALSSVTPAKPKAVLGACNGHAALDFNGAALAVTAANDPLVGKNKWTIAVVFQTTAGYSDTSGGNNNFYRHAGLLGNEIGGVGKGDWAIALAANGKLCAGLGAGGSTTADYTFWSALPSQRDLLDDRPHVAIYTAGDTEATLNLDGYTTTQTTASVGNRASISSSVSFLIGASQNNANTLARGFNGKIAEIRIYPGEKLDAAAVSALGAELAATYGAGDGWKFACDVDGATAGSIPAAAVPAAVDPNDGATVWEADTLSAADGATIEEWTAKTDAEKSATFSAVDIASVHAPTLVKDAINGCAALRFSTADKSALGIPAASLPVAGSVDYSMVVVFRAKRDGENAESSHAFNGLGLLSTEIGGSDQKDTILSFMDRGRVACTYGGYGLEQKNYLSEGIKGNVSADQSLYAPVYGMDDGETHCVIASVDGTNGNIWMMADGSWTSAQIESAQAARDDSMRMLVGGVSGQGSQITKFFDGDIAAIRLYNRALTVAEMDAVTDYYAAKYAIRRAPTVGVDSATAPNYGLAATNIAVASGAVLRLPSGEASPFKVGAGQTMSCGGTVQGTLGVASGGVLSMGGEGMAVEDLRLDSGAQIVLTDAFVRNPSAISASTLAASGAVNVAFGDGVTASSFAAGRVPLITSASAPSLDGGVSSWTCTKGRVMLVGNTLYYTPAAGIIVIFR